MSDFELREYRPDDVPALSALWTECFGDGPGFTEKFFAALPGMGSGVAAVRGGEILGAAYTLNAQELICGEGVRRVGYIYGVGVSARARSQAASWCTPSCSHRPRAPMAMASVTTFMA